MGDLSLVDSRVTSIICEDHFPSRTCTLEIINILSCVLNSNTLWNYTYGI